MKSLLEKAIIQLLNGNDSKAEALFHKFMVERAREIHESLRQSQDVELKEGWDHELSEDEYFDDDDDDLDGVEDTGGVDAVGGDMAAGEEFPGVDDEGAELDDFDLRED